MSNFLSSIAVIFSLIAGVMSIFNIYKVSGIEQQIGTLNQSISNQQEAQKNLASGGIAETTPPQETAEAATSNAPPTPANVTSIQPGQFVQPALENRAEVTLLTAKRIQDPDTAARDVVNVQFRVRRMGKAGITSIISPVNTAARNPDTGETYDSYRDSYRTAGIKADKEPSEDRATSGVPLVSVEEGASVDAYVWLKVPEEVNIIDIYIPKTQPFRNVPIAN
jgi:cytoskeletal protein RodZ